MVHKAKHFAVQAAIPFKKYLGWPEYPRDNIQRYMPLMHLVKEMIPIFVFGEYGQPGLYGIQKFTRILPHIYWKIINSVGQRRVLSYFVTRWRKKSNNDRRIWILAAHLFQNRPALLKFSEGCEVKPNTVAAMYTPRIFTPLHPKFGFFIEKRCDPNSKEI